MILNKFKYGVLFVLTIMTYCSFTCCAIYCPSIDETFQKLKKLSKVPVPECPEGNNEPRYKLYTRDNPEHPLILNLTSFPFEKLRVRTLYRFLVHGWNSNGNHFIELKDELIKKEEANAIIVDWSEMANNQYFSSASNTRTVAAHIAMMIKHMKTKLTLSNVWCIGHSLGSHVCGQAGRKMKFNRITGLDPAGPSFKRWYNSLKGLKQTDADFVDVIHTTTLFGIFTQLGHADFYPNGGKKQLACKHSVCSHSLATKYLTDSMKNGCETVTKCLDIKSFESTCHNCIEDCSMGYNANPSNHGSFFVKVGESEPYCQA